MMSVNLMFHLSSALIFLVLVYFLLRQQKKLRLHERLWKVIGSRERSVLVDWPQNFLKSLCEAWQLPFMGSDRPESAQRIDPKAWVDCHIALCIRGIDCSGKSRLSVEVARADLSGEWKKTLELALAGRYTVELKLSERAGIAQPP